MNGLSDAKSRIFFEPFDFAVTLEADTEVKAFEPRFVCVAYEGAWQGYKSGAFMFTPQDLAQMVGNLRNLERYKPNGLSATREECEGHKWGVILFDWRHLTEMDPRTVPIENQRAFGWVIDAEVRTPMVGGDLSGLKSSSGKAELWAYSYFTEEATGLINDHKVKWLSITANPRSIDKRSGQNIGWVMSSIALTNQPFLEGLPALPFQMEDDAARDGATKGHVSMKLNKACMEWLGVSNTDDHAEMAGAIHGKHMDFMAMKKKCDEDAATAMSWKAKCEEKETLCKTMEAKCAEYEKQFGHLKKAASDLPAEGFGVVLAEQIAGLKKIADAENDGLGKVGIVMAEYRSLAQQFQKQRPQYDAMLLTSAEGERVDAKTDIDRVMAEKGWDESMRPMVENYRKGAFSDDRLISTENGRTTVSLEALQARKTSREAFLKQFPPTGTANMTQNFVGIQSHQPFGVVAASGAGGLNNGANDGVGFGARSGFSQQQHGSIRLEVEGRGQVDVDLSTFPGAPLEKAQAALRQAQPTRFKDCFNATHGSWIQFNREAARLLEQAVSAGQLQISADLGFGS